MVDALDHSGGQVLEALSERRLSENTVVVFVSDNGGLSTAEGHNTSNRPLRCGKGWVYEGGIRVPHVIYWPGVTYTGSTTDVPAIMTDLYPTLFDAAGLPKCPDEHVDGTSLAPVLKGRSSQDCPTSIGTPCSGTTRTTPTREASPVAPCGADRGN
jgi:arylsulfatase A-like enzyme